MLCSTERSLIAASARLQGLATSLQTCASHGKPGNSMRQILHILESKPPMPSTISFVSLIGAGQGLGHAQNPTKVKMNEMPSLQCRFSRCLSPMPRTSVCAVSSAALNNVSMTSWVTPKLPRHWGMLENLILQNFVDDRSWS